MKNSRLNKRNPLLSIIIPLYNEEKRVKNLLKIYNFFKKKQLNYELILVNDGSLDSTMRLVNNLSKKIKFNLISYRVNKGKGFAIKQGMLNAKGMFRLFTDIDLSTPIEEFEKFLPYLKKNQIVIGSRKTTGSNLKKRQPILREGMGKAFTLLSKFLLNLDTSDFTCGFKCFSRIASEKIFQRMRIDRWGFDSEILFIAKKMGYRVKEIPVIWSDHPGSKVKFPHAIFSSIMDLIRIRLGNYN